MPKYTLLIRVTVEAEDSDTAMEMAFAICDDLSPAGALSSSRVEPVVRNIQFDHAETVTKKEADDA